MADRFSEELKLAIISHWLTVAARGTYEAGTENILKPAALRAYNEVQHRVTAALRDRLSGVPTFSFEDIVEMIRGIGERHDERSNIDFFMNTAFKFWGESWPPADAN